MFRLIVAGVRAQRGKKPDGQFPSPFTFDCLNFATTPVKPAKFIAGTFDPLAGALPFAAAWLYTQPASDACNAATDFG